MHNKSYFYRIRHNEDGVAAIEFALIAPVLLSLLLGMIQIGFVLVVMTSMQGAAKSAVRTTAVQYQSINAQSHSTSKKSKAKTRGREAAVRSLGHWWDMFFEDSPEKHIQIDCERSNNVSVWEAEIEIAYKDVLLVPVGIFDKDDIFKSTATWPAPQSGCP